jgi:mannose/fructose/N-acetylgalactosamine-specific phosphotransferase system component IIB
MTNKDIKEFYKHKHYGTELNNHSVPKTTPASNQNKIYELSHIKTGERLIHGQYALCKHKFNSLNPKEKNNYIICKYKQ